MTDDELIKEHEFILSQPSSEEIRQRLAVAKHIPLGALLYNIHHQDRVIETTNFLGGSTGSRVCRLDFLGLSTFYVSELGAVWRKTNIVPNKQGKLTNKYLPMARLDPRYRTNWANLPILGTNGAWVPMTTLLGWAFHPVKAYGIYYALTKDSCQGNITANDVYWSRTPKEDPNNLFESKFLSFTDSFNIKLLPNT